MKTEYEMFELAPVSLWLEDYSGVRAQFDVWRSEGVTDLRAHLHADRGRAVACSRQLKVVRVNRRTLELFGASDLRHLTDNLHRVFGEATIEPYTHELVALTTMSQADQRMLSAKRAFYAASGVDRRTTQQGDLAS
jgi:hypothetical protein